MATMRVYRRRPRIQVDIWHRYIEADKPRESFSESSFGDLLAVTTDKDVKEAAGQFTLIFTAKADNRGRTWKDKISTMDYVAIFMGSGLVPGVRDVLEVPEVVMRGFVSTVTMSRAIMNDKPQMVVEVIGHDYGKLFTRANLFHPTISGEGDFLFFGDELDAEGRNAFFYDFWNLSAADAGGKDKDPSGANPFALSPVDFLRAIGDGTPNADGTARHSIIESYISLKDAPRIRAETRADQFWKEAKVPLASSTAVLGSVQNLLDAFRSAPWYELYVLDRWQGPRIIWRLTPYKDLDGNYLALGGGTSKTETLHPVPVDTITLGQEWVQATRLGRTDADQYSYFMAMPEAIGANDVAYRAFYGQPRDKGVGAAVWDRILSRQYGFRPMEVPFPLLWFPDAIDNNNASAKESEFFPMIWALNQWLYDAFKDQYLYESGSMQVAGDPRLRIGTYVKLEPPGVEYYIESVAHSFTWQERGTVRYDTTLGVVRGRYPKLPFDTLPSLGREPAFTPPTLGGGGGGTSQPPATSGGGSTQGPTPTGLCIYPAGNGTNITTPFGPDHPALDLANDRGSLVRAPHGGVIIAYRRCTWNSGSFPNGGCPGAEGPPTTESPTYGSFVQIQAPGGGISMLAHTAPIAGLTIGQRVGMGQQIGVSDNTGKTTGPHTHWEYRLQNGTLLTNPIVTCIQNNQGIAAAT